jgi:hypothetical protein
MCRGLSTLFCIARAHPHIRRVLKAVETPVPGFVLHLSEVGTVADQGGVPPDRSSGSDQQGVCDREDCRP